MNQPSFSAHTGYGTNPPAGNPTSVRFLKAWVLFMILSVVCSAGAGFVVGAIAGAIMGAAGVDIQKIMYICQGLGFLVSLPVSFICFRWATTRFILPQLGFPDASAGPGQFA